MTEIQAPSLSKTPFSKTPIAKTSPPRTSLAKAPSSLRSPMKARPDYSNISFLTLFHLLGAFAVYYLAAIHFSWWTVGLGIFWFIASGLSITAGYHRLYAHRSYEAHPIVRGVLLAFGAASVQNSALRWARDHRMHHARTDKAEDPYNIQRGFLWAHIGWIMWRPVRPSTDLVKDLRADPLVRFQDRYYIPIAWTMGAAVPMLIGFAWGDPLGALLVVGFLRLVLQWHATFSVNSVAHMFGSQPFSDRNSARDSFWTSLVTFGEGYHNFHHSFKSDYRNGIRWFHFDPTKWVIWTLSKCGATRNLRRTTREAIAEARQRMKEHRRARLDGTGQRMPVPVPVTATATMPEEIPSAER